MNVRIRVRAMECMCAQTRPLFILSSESFVCLFVCLFVFFWGGGGGVGMESEPMFTPMEKSPQPENSPQRRIEPRRCIKQDSEPSTLPTSSSGPIALFKLLQLHFHSSAHRPTGQSTSPSFLTSFISFGCFFSFH